LIEKNNFGMTPNESGAGIPIALQDNFVSRVYALVDAAVACELDRLRSEEGIIPSCKAGCDYCCRYHIVMNIAEAQNLAHYIRRSTKGDGFIF